MPRTHRKSHTPEYRVWKHIKGRCLTTTDAAYKNYGGRGITICEEWKNDFMKFLNHMGCRPTPHHTIERINNNGNYEPTNCCWALRVDQCANQRKTRRFTAHNMTHTIPQWSKILNIHVQTLWSRINSGKSLNEVFTPKKVPTAIQTINYKGQVKTIPQWARHLGISPQALRYRINAGWTIQRAFNIPN